MPKVYATNQIAETWGKMALVQELTPAKKLVVFPNHADDEYLELEMDVITNLQGNITDVTQILNFGTDINANVSFLRLHAYGDHQPTYFVKARKRWSGKSTEIPTTAVTSHANSMELAISAKHHGGVYSKIDTQNATCTLCLTSYKHTEPDLEHNSLISVIFDSINDMLIINAPHWGMLYTHPLDDDIADLITTQSEAFDDAIRLLMNSDSMLVKNELKTLIKRGVCDIDTAWPVGKTIFERVKNTELDTIRPSINEKDIVQIQMPC